MKGVTLLSPFCWRCFPESVAEDKVVSPHPVGHPWRIVSAVCVQRMPSLSRDKTDIELRYEQLKDKIRIEKSKLSDFELEEAEHLAIKKEREKRALEEDLDLTQVCKLWCKIQPCMNL